MQVLITGANGFLGAALVKELLQQKHQICIVVRKHADLWRLKDVLSFIKVYFYEEKIAETIDVIYHMAWQGVENRFRNSSHFEENLALCKYVVKVAKELLIKKIIALGSQAEYGPQNKILNENDPLFPSTIYGLEKDKCRLYLEDECQSSNIAFTWVRVFSTYGFCDNPSWLIPYVIETFLDHRSPQLTLGDQKWDYLFSDDAASALAALADAEEGIYNLGGGKCISIRSVIEYIYTKIKPPCELKFGQKPYAKDQIFFLQADISKILKKTRWKPLISLEKGLDMLIAYHITQRKSILLNL